MTIARALARKLARMDKHLKERFGGIDRLYGSGALARFAA